MPPADWPRTLSAALLRAGRADGKSVITIDADGRQHTADYTRLITAAGPVRLALRAAGVARTEPVVLAVRNNWRFLTAFWACVLEGCVPTPIGPPRSGNSMDADHRRLAGVCELLGGPVVVIDEEQTRPVAGARYLDLRPLPGGRTGGEPFDDIADPRPDDIAVNLLTSGSTGLPKCVPLTNRALAHRAWAAARHSGFGPDEVALNWMPLDHVGGLVMWCVQAIFLGCEYINVDTQRIIADPLAWLDLLTKFGVTMTWAPNFAYGLVNGELRQGTERVWDLRALRHVLNGGEAVVGATAQEFGDRLACHGLRPDAVHPSWGMSETGSGVVYSCLDAADAAVGMLHVDPASLDGELAFVHPGRARSIPLTVTGVPIPGVTVRVVGKDGQVLPYDHVGDLEITGETLFGGYVGNEEANRRAFTADGWFRTGDRAFVSNGELTIVGRGNDDVVINGVNVPVHDIEAAIETIADVRPGFVAVCGVDTRHGRQKIVVFAAPRTASGHSREPVARRIREVVGRDFGFTPDDVVMVAAESFPKTAIGKIQRKRLAAEYARTEDPASWMFAPTWQESAPSAPADTAPETFLLFRDAEQTSEPTPPGVIHVSRGRAFRELEPLRFEVDPDDGKSYAALYAALERQGLRPSAALYAWLPDSDFESRPTPGPEVFDQGGPASLLTMLQSATRSPAPFRRLFVVTHHACAIRPEDPTNPLASIASGLVRTARSEGTGIDVRQVDFGTEETLADILATLSAEAHAADGEAVVGYRDGTRYVARTVPVRPSEQAAASPLRTGATALITGGLGDVGYEIARHLQDRYAMDLVLVGRSPAQVGGTGTPSERLTALAGRGRVHYLCCDAGDEQAVERGVADIESRWGTTVGLVLHLASENIGDNWRAPEQHILTNEPVETFRTVLRSKFLSAWAATRLAARRPSCALVLFSSLNGFFGASPFGSYAAACTGVDAFARHGARAGTGPVHCLAWSVWSGLGMSRKGEELNAAARRRGFRTMTRDDALELFEIALGVDERYLLLGFDPVPEAEAAEPTTEPATTAGQSAMTEAPERTRPRTSWERTVATVWSQVLGTADIEIDTSFFSMGGTSIMAIRSAAILADTFGARIRVTDLYDNPTVRTLADLAQRITERDPE
ncbi:SDR family NAD(P)-dependent oxidoreductase [Kitasatospora sp. NPDC001175]|uniref:SDR family NAD(P)-dependent oxidoreductase n=1 Tax=Kitasatospora sp. NPDC001175 TaxID=3157103 RepID=UPI003CFC6B6A